APSLQGPGGPAEPPTIATDTPWPDEPPGSGPSIPGYHFLGMLGMGGLAVVYRVRNVTTGRLEALKVLRDGVDTAPASGCPLLVHESMLLAQFQHPNIITLYTLGCDQGRHYTVMELAEGGDLSRRLQDGPLAPQLAARLMEAIASAIHHVHSRGV